MELSLCGSDLLANALLEYETLGRADLDTLLETGDVPTALKEKAENDLKAAAASRPKKESPRPETGSSPSPQDLAPGQA